MNTKKKNIIQCKRLFHLLIYLNVKTLKSIKHVMKIKAKPKTK